MGTRSMEDLKDMICRELDELAEKGEMSAGDLDTVYKLIMSKEKLLRIEELEEGLGYSHSGSWNARGSYDGGRYSNRRYDESGDSYAGRRGMHYVRGHYSRGRYSYDDGMQELRTRIEEMMEDGTLTNADRQTLKRAMDVLNK